MPVFNEQAALLSVAREWFAALQSAVGDFILLAINDGSTDGTLAVLDSLRMELGAKFEIVSRSNRGHGQSCIEGYEIALARGIPFILQIDSDGQSEPRHFQDFWNLKDQYGVIYGKRTRQDGVRRIVASGVLRVLLRLLVGVDCVDANVPYRLMNAAACETAIRAIPSDLCLANIALAVALRMDPSIRHGLVPITFPARRGGEPSVPFLKFAAKGVELFAQLKKAGIRR